MTTPARCIVLTGATRGLGRAMTEQFIALGHTVLGCGRSAAELERLRRRFDSPHDFAAVDVTQRDEVQAWADRLLAVYGAPDLLVNNAAVMNANAVLWEVPADEFDRLIDINIKGVANVLRCFVPAMIARGRGVIVNFSSAWGRSTSPQVAPYCASKFAIEGLTQALAQELPRGLAAIPLNPGIIDTDMLRSCFGDDAGHYPPADEWSKRAVPFLLQLGRRDNGKSLSVP
ncbi:MAG TPA: SDR family NAD(P)-dependent oxidoreductase [Gemmataceae bacterium]|jgi:NAD(P)-dependent dehydrogenase (short-subunit alcohol dehydrogenase family)